MSDEIKDIVFDDERFAEYRKNLDDVDVVLDLMEFKHVLTDQIHMNRSVGDRGKEWERGITSIVIRVKSRIAAVKRDLRAAGRGEEVSDALYELREEEERDDE